MLFPEIFTKVVPIARFVVIERRHEAIEGIAHDEDEVGGIVVAVVHLGVEHVGRVSGEETGGFYFRCAVEVESDGAADCGAGRLSDVDEAFVRRKQRVYAYADTIRGEIETK